MQKMKLERVEKERNELRLNTDRLESRVSPFVYVIVLRGWCLRLGDLYFSPRFDH